MNATAPKPPHDPQRIDGLVEAFDQFNAMSHQLQSSWSALEARVTELTRERDAAEAARLEVIATREHEADRLQARLAHQLRTPLATAVLYLSRLADGGLDADASRRMAGKALARLVDLQQLIDQTLALARGTTGASGASAVVAVGELLHDAVASRVGPQSAGLAIDIDDASGGAIVRGQRSLLTSVLVNLLDNAAMFASRVTLAARRVDADIVITIHDDGAGIDADAAPHIFEPFFTTRPCGTGLGLATARTIARAHGGELRLVPGIDGACFEWRLPAGDDNRPLASAIRAHRAASVAHHPHQGTTP